MDNRMKKMIFGVLAFCLVLIAFPSNSFAATDNVPTGAAGGGTGLSASAALNDGTYLGRGNGRGDGLTYVSVVISDRMITSINVLSHGDTESYFNDAKDTIISGIIAAQDVDSVDAVSGATQSSNGIKAAAAAALAKSEQSDTSGYTEVGDTISDPASGLSFKILTEPDAAGAGTVAVIKGQGDYRIKDVVIPEEIRDYTGAKYKVERISKGSFTGDYIKTISIPKTITDIEIDAFWPAYLLERFFVDAASEHFTVVDKVLFSKDMTKLFWYPKGAPETSYVIPSSVTVVDWGAFGHCNNLVRVEIPESVTFIDQYAFTECLSIESLFIPKDAVFYLNSIGGLEGLSDFGIASGNPSFQFENGVLLSADKTQLLSVYTSVNPSFTVPDGVVEIANNAFAHSTDLTKITFPSTLKKIGVNAFHECGLKSVSLPEGVEEIGNLAFSECDSLTDIILPASLKSIGNSVFKLAKGLKNITFLGGTPPEIGVGVFAFVLNGLTVKVPDDVAITAYESVMANELPASSRIIVGKADSGQGSPSGTPGGGYSGGSGSGNYAPAVTAEPEGQVNAGETAPANTHDSAIGGAPAFTDISGHWAEDAIQAVVAAKLFSGVGAAEFAPNATMTRAMFATVLARYAGGSAKGGVSFSDIPSGRWYTDGVLWAAENGIVSGIGGGLFDPNVNVTREQLAAILYNYAKFMGFDVSGAADISSFADGVSVSSWAGDAVSWAIAKGFIAGRPDGILDPRGSATRAEAATILMRFIGFANQSPEANGR